MSYLSEASNTQDKSLHDALYPIKRRLSSRVARKFQNCKVTQQFHKQPTPINAATLMSKLSENIDVISKGTNGGEEIDDSNGGGIGGASDRSTELTERNITYFQNRQ